MKFKKANTNEESVNNPSKPPALENKTLKGGKQAKTSENHQHIVKRLLNHSPYNATSLKKEPAEVTYSSPTYVQYPGPPQYPTQYPSCFQHTPAVYSSNNYYSKDFYYQQPQLNNQYPIISPPLSSHSTYNYDQVSNGSPSSDYVFNGELTVNFDGSFPLIDAAKNQQLFDNQAPLEMKPFEVESRIGGQLTPLTIESLHHDGEIKNSFVPNNSNVFVNLSDDDVLSNASYLSRSSPSGTVDLKFFEHQ